MIQGYAVEDGHLSPVEAPLAAPDDVVWFDLHDPTDAEEEALERLLGIGLPTRDEMQEIEDSSRLYTENGAAYMTANLPARVDSDEPILEPVTFVLVRDCLVTIRYHEPRAFHTFATRAERVDLGCSDGITALMALLEVVVDRLADILEKIGRDIEHLSRSVFRPTADATKKGGPDYAPVLQGLGRQGDLIANVLDSLMTIERLIAFLTAATAPRPLGKDARVRVKTLGRDTRFLAEHANTLSQKLTFLLDATLGMISIQQNAIIKIFSVAAVIFLPPTLVASIYGMNFEVMPELQWIAGYPFALGLMIASAAGSYWVFKRRGWL
jgi:magnesium transporter